MTDQCTANGQCIPDKELDSLLTVRDLLAVLTSIFGKGQNVCLFLVPLLIVP